MVGAEQPKNGALRGGRHSEVGVLAVLAGSALRWIACEVDAARRAGRVGAVVDTLITVSGFLIVVIAEVGEAR